MHYQRALLAHHEKKKESVISTFNVDTGKTCTYYICLSVLHNENKVEMLAAYLPARVVQF